MVMGYGRWGSLPPACTLEWVEQEGEEDDQGPSTRVVCSFASGIQRASTASGREAHLPLPLFPRVTFQECQREGFEGYISVHCKLYVTF